MGVSVFWVVYQGRASGACQRQAYEVVAVAVSAVMKWVTAALRWDNQGEVREQREGISIDGGRTRPPVGGLGRRRHPAAEDVRARGSRYLGHGSLEAHHGEQSQEHRRIVRGA